MGISVRNCIVFLTMICSFYLHGAWAATITTIASFPAGLDGQWPYAGLVKYGSVTYGTTQQGGADFDGVIFQMNPATGATKTVYSFTGAVDGVGPGSLLLAGKMFYGTTLGDNRSTYGTVFSFNPATRALTTLHIFSVTDGAEPVGTLVSIGGMLYGVASYGGANGYGVAYKLDPSTGTQTILHAFAGGTDGEYPSSTLLKSGNFLYGTTQYGGSSANDGTVFRINLTTGVETVLHSFTGPDGADPTGAITFVDGVLYGSSAYGGANGWGCVYNLHIQTRVVTPLHSFNYDANGFFPAAGLTNVGGVLYGTTESGTSPTGGTIFSVDPTTMTTTTVYTFSDYTGTSETGNTPLATLLNIDGVLYGATAYGGSATGGTLFSFTPGTSTLKTLHAFTGVGSGQYANASLLQVGDLFYGTTPQGGAAALGSVFSLNPSSGRIKTLLGFTGGNEGYDPQAPLTLVGSTLYGTTHGNSIASGAGTVFSFDTTTNALSTLYAFSAAGLHGPSNGAAYPNSGLLALGSTLYGTTSGLNGGAVYSFVPNTGTEATLTVLPSQGYNHPSQGGLVAFGGILYGTDGTGGSNNLGSVISTDPSSGQTKTIYSFTGKNDGAGPASGLALINGLLYGTTTTGGAAYNGTLFRIDPTTGTLITLHGFNGDGAGGGTPDGAAPTATLLAVGSVLYGTTKSSGPAYNGTVFAYDTAGASFSTLYAFTGAADGGAPQAALINDNGVLYGTTSIGGAANRGTAFSVTP